ncbi:MAG: DUF4159 domain-containing protein [Chitinophagales bacterium]|nr:DUF4159 domain-containing protein [Chitinophagaceae bacterium]MCB9063705.1 DUF4159 domain-containing protein [Chitinophagales bacterium]
MIRKLLVVCLLLSTVSTVGYAQKMKLGLLVYTGGGDWYANPTALKNLASFCNKSLQTNFDLQEAQVEANSPDIYNYPFIHMTGHGRWIVSDEEAKNLRDYMMAGGFLHIDDNYGLDEYVRPVLKKIFPNIDLVEVPFSHPIYKQPYDFSHGVPKIHEHDNKAPQGYGIFYNGRLVCYYTTETDLGDGWEDPEVHNDTREAHRKALEMGANIVQYALTGTGS